MKRPANGCFNTRTNTYTTMDKAVDKALKQFADLMIEKIHQVKDNWQKPWFLASTKGTGLPQNIEGRIYNGVNSSILFLLSEKMNYNLPVYMTFMQAKNSGLNILKGEKSFPVIYWNFSIKDEDGKKITLDQYNSMSKEERDRYKVTPFLKTYNVFNVQQTNLKEISPEKWEALERKHNIPILKDEQGMFTMPLLDTLIREQKWICPIHLKKSDSAYHVKGSNNHIVIPLKGQFNSGESFYSTLLHEMAHSTGEPAYLNREKGMIFGDEKYAKEELIAELTAATVGRSIGISTHIREENAMYIKGWLLALKEDPKFIYSILSEVGKANEMIQGYSNQMEQHLSTEEKFMLAIIRNDKQSLENMKANGFIPSSKEIDRIKINGISEISSKYLHEIFDLTIPHSTKESNIQNKSQLEL